MAERKKVKPKNPAKARTTTSGKKAESKSTARKTAVGRWGRKSARKTSKVKFR